VGKQGYLRLIIREGRLTLESPRKGNKNFSDRSQRRKKKGKRKERKEVQVTSICNEEGKRKKKGELMRGEKGRRRLHKFST